MDDYYARDVLQPLGKHYFKKFPLYNLDMDVDLEKFKVASGTYGGPVAFYMPQSITSDGKSSPRLLQIMSPSGQLLTEMIWPNGDVSEMGWTVDEQLLFVQKNGFIFIYSCLGPQCASRPVFKEKFTIGKDAEKLGVLSSCIFSSRQGTGVAVLAGNYRIYCVNNYADGALRQYRMAEIHGLNTTPSCWTVVQGENETLGIVAQGSELTSVNPRGEAKQILMKRDLPVSRYVAVEVSLNRKLMALYSDNGVVWIGSIDGSQCLREYNTMNGKRALQQMVWCTNDALMLSWQDAGGHSVILMGVDDDNDPLEYFYDTAVSLFPERDGVRILSPTAHEFVQQVPAVLCDILLFSSVTHPGSNLYTATSHLGKGNPEAHEYLNMVRDRMEVAVDQCLKAAGHSWDTIQQKQLLQAAGIGKSFLFNYNRDSFYLETSRLRVLNTLRLREIGMPLSYLQFELLGIERVIDRLIVRGHYPLVERICEYLDIPETTGINRMLEHWALVKVLSKGDENAIANQIIDKFGGRPGIGYAEIASKAKDANKQTVAERLLDCETRINKQVPLLLKMGLGENALTKAVKSGDTELIHVVLQHLMKELKKVDFLKIVQKSPTALALYVDSCQYDTQIAIHEQEDNFLAQARILQRELFQSDQLSQREMIFTQVADLYRKGQCEFGYEETRYAKMLITRQREIESEFPQISVVNTSLHNTLLQIGKAGKMKIFEAMRKDFNVSEKRYWCLMVEIYASTGDWPGLEKFAKSKRSPVGYEPFFNACIELGQVGEAEKYVARMEVEPRVRALFRLGQLDEAIALAVQRGSEEGLRYLECHTHGPDRERVFLESKKLVE